MERINEITQIEDTIMNLIEKSYVDGKGKISIQLLGEALEDKRKNYRRNNTHIWKLNYYEHELLIAAEMGLSDAYYEMGEFFVKDSEEISSSWFANALAFGVKESKDRMEELDIRISNDTIAYISEAASKNKIEDCIISYFNDKKLPLDDLVECKCLIADYVGIYHTQVCEKSGLKIIPRIASCQLNLYLDAIREGNKSEGVIEYKVAIIFKECFNDYYNFCIWLKAASISGNIDSMLDLSLGYYGPLYGLDSNKVEYKFLLLKASEAGSATAMEHIGWDMYRFEGSSDEDRKAGYGLVKKAASLGNPFAVRDIADIYFNDKKYADALENYVKAIELYKVEEIDTDSIYLKIALIYHNGMGCDTDRNKALSIVKDIDINNLGTEEIKKQIQIYEENELFEEAFDALQKCETSLINTGIEIDTEILYKLGVAYYYGKGTKIRKQKGKEYLREAKNRGSEEAKSCLDKLKKM